MKSKATRQCLASFVEAYLTKRRKIRGGQWETPTGFLRRLCKPQNESARLVRIEGRLQHWAEQKFARLLGEYGLDVSEARDMTRALKTCLLKFQERSNYIAIFIAIVSLIFIKFSSGVARLIELPAYVVELSVAAILLAVLVERIRISEQMNVYSEVCTIADSYIGRNA
jgi:hypothetical protein